MLDLNNISTYSDKNASLLIHCYHILYVIGVNIGGDLNKCLIFLCSLRSDDVNGGVWHHFRRRMVYYKCFFEEQVRSTELIG